PPVVVAAEIALRLPLRRVDEIGLLDQRAQRPLYRKQPRARLIGHENPGRLHCSSLASTLRPPKSSASAPIRRLVVTRPTTRRYSTRRGPTCPAKPKTGL